MTEGLIHNQNTDLVGDRIIPSSSPSDNWCIRERFDRFITGKHIHVFGGELEDDEVVAEATGVCIEISLVS